MLPCDSSDGVVVVDLFAANLIPLRSLSVEVVDVESVEVSNNCSLSSRVEGSAGELLNFLVFGIVESLEAISRWFIECDFTVISCGKNV